MDNPYEITPEDLERLQKEISQLKTALSHYRNNPAPHPGAASYGQLVDHLESAWGIIANSNNGNWASESSEWQDAALKWRDAYHRILASLKPEQPPISA